MSKNSTSEDDSDNLAEASLEKSSSNREPDHHSYENFATFTAFVTAVTLLKESAELAKLALENPAIALVVAIGLSLLLLSSLVLTTKVFLNKRRREGSQEETGNTKKQASKKVFHIGRVAIVALALALLVSGTALMSTRGVYYVILESSSQRPPLADRATQLNSRLTQASFPREVRVLGQRSGREEKYFALAVGPYLTRPAADEGLGQLHRLLEEQVRADAWVSKAALVNLDMLLQKVGL